MKKIMSTAMILLIASQILTGCTNSKDNTNVVDPSTTNTVDNNGGNDSTTDLDKYETVGEINEINGDTVSILTGDIMEDFKQVEGIDKCYIGETVGIIKKDNGYTVEKINADFTVRHTTMGDIIERVDGTIKEMTDKQVIIATKDGDVTIAISEPLTGKVGDNLMVDYVTYDEKTLYNVYYKDSVLTLNVDKINRIDTTGEMMLFTKDSEGMEYHIILQSETVVDFNLSELKVDDQIDVYAEVIREKYPAEVDAKMVMRVDDKNSDK